MQLGESVAIASFGLDSDECPFQPHSKDEGFTQSKRPGDKEVKKLQKAMKSGQSTRVWHQSGTSFTEKTNKDGPKHSKPKAAAGQPIRIAGVDYPLSVAAHHIIPGKASLPKSELAPYIWADEGGVIKSDIGYDVDGSENGLWMPTHQSMSAKLGKAQKLVIHDEEKPPETKGMSWQQLSDRAKEHDGDPATYTQLFLPRYTQQAMDALYTQFHDSHSNYNTWVTKRLNGLAVRLHTKVGFCEKCKEDDKKSPPYSLVYRLNMVSRMILINFLGGGPKAGWKRVHTSDFARRYAENPLPKDKLGRD